MKHEGNDGEGKLHKCVSPQWIPQLARPLAYEHRAERHAAQEDREHQHLRIRRVPHEQAEVPRPYGLVDEPRRARDDEDDVRNQSHVAPRPSLKGVASRFLWLKRELI